ncbi:MAG: filamentous hemagglutinin N-terminal domain-containing protein, partial [Novosphingobium sp.]
MIAAARPQRYPGRRKALHLSTALASGLFAAGQQQVHAQSATDTLPVLSATQGASFDGTVITPTASSLDIDINDAARVINWQTYNIGLGNTVGYTSADTTTPLAVLNRVTGLDAAPNTIFASQIDGTLQSQSNIAVWLTNPAGITFGPTGTFNGGSLVLTSLGISDADFLDGYDNPPPGDAFDLSGGTGGIVLTAGSGTLSATGNVILAAPRISVSKSIAATGDVALVAAQDVSFTSGIDSPLSITINQGTPIGGALEVLGTGTTISGGSVALVGASDSAVIGALLNVGVDAGASLTATAVDGAVILATADVPGISVAENGDSIVANGSLIASGPGGDVIVAAGGDATVGGDVTAAGDYTVVGNAVTLGTDSATRTQSAGGAVDITARTGSITGVGALTLRSDSDDSSADDDLLLDAALGTVTFGPDTLLATGAAVAPTTSGAGIGLIVSPTASVTLGDFDTAAIGNATRVAGVTIDPTLAIGDDLTFDTGTLRAGTFTADIAGDLRLASLTAPVIDLTVAGDLTGLAETS